MRHQSILLNVITVGFSAIFLLMALFMPGTAGSVAIWAVLASVFIIGIPHGAIDHVMAAELYGLNQSLKDHLIFYSSYLLIMFAVGLLWYLLPIAGMALFLIISIYHFGQADMEEFLQTQKQAVVWHIARGTLIIGLIIFSEPAVTYPIMAEAMNLNTADFAAWMPGAQQSVIAVILVYLALTGTGILLNRFEDTFRLVLDSLLLICVLIITGPLIGFALYFALWHSAGHISEMRDFFQQKGKSLSVSGFYRKAMPFTLVSLFGLAFLAGLNHAFGMDEQFLSLMFILISVLTLPHMVIVNRMYKYREQE